MSYTVDAEEKYDSLLTDWLRTGTLGNRWHKRYGTWM